MENINSYLCFKLGNDLYAANVKNTIKILQYTDITQVPNSPDQLVGVINHHGNVLPVVDLKKSLNLPETDVSSNTCILILSMDESDDSGNIGAIVDEVLKVEEINKSDMKEAPTIGKDKTLTHIEGVIKIDDEFVMILNTKEILGSLSESIS